MMPEDITVSLRYVVFAVFLILIAGRLVAGDSLETDRQVLLQLKSFLEEQNRVNRGVYTTWNSLNSSPCTWRGISCDVGGNRVTRISLSGNSINGEMFGNFSALTELTFLDLSKNTIGGTISADLGLCQNLKLLNLSHNLIDGELKLNGLKSLEILDLSVNRIVGNIQFSFPEICNSLVVLNLSGNHLIGEIGNSFHGCLNLKYLDLSSNNLTGDIWFEFDSLLEFVASENKFTGSVPSLVFTKNCSLQTLDLSENSFEGLFPMEISNCKDLATLNLWGNHFNGTIPQEIGLLSKLRILILGSNKFSRDIPESLLGLRNLAFLDLSKNRFGGFVQDIFGRFNQLKFLVLHGNSYIGGIHHSGVLKLPNISRLDLSYNNFTGQLPLEISQMFSLRFLMLAYNQFTGSIPPEYGNLSGIQALDLSFNRLSGSIPPSLGKLKSLLWLMLANNSLTGEIPAELGKCSSLLWLNLANNQLRGIIPPQLTNIGLNASTTFLLNRQADEITAGSGECLAMRRWIPEDYPPFSFVYILLTRKNCRILWERLIKGYGLFPRCARGSNIWTFQISGYVQLSGNQLSGELPRQIGKMQDFSLLNLGFNGFYGTLPPEIYLMPLVVLNLTQNKFSGQIPLEIGNIKCLQNLDLSYNNFSGPFPSSLNNLSELSKFNISYNPYISGVIPSTGQLATFEKWSFIGNPMLRLPSFMENSNNGGSPVNYNVKAKNLTKLSVFLVILALVLAFLVSGLITLIICAVAKSPRDAPGYLLEDAKSRNDWPSSSRSSPWLSNTVKVIHLDNKTAFTHSDILKATGNFSNDRVIGRGGFGTVYRGVLPDGREVAIKKLQREGIEGEKEFRSEMEVLSVNGFGWPHPNLVALYGWCLYGSEKLLVYEYMGGGSLDDLLEDRTRFSWRRRLDVAIDVARALVFLHHECFPAIVHRDVKASNVLLDKNGRARVTDFGLARVVDAGDSHVSTMVAGTIGYVAPEYGQTWQATTKGDVYSYGVLAMELATGRRAVDGGEECLVEWAKRIMGAGRHGFNNKVMIPVALLVSGLAEGAEELCELLRIGIRCTAETPQERPNMKEVSSLLIKIPGSQKDSSYGSSPSSS